MLKKMAEWFKNIFIYPPELKEIQQRALETNRIYESALKKAKPALKKATTRANKAVWPKDFDAKDVAKALNKQAPKPLKEKPMPLKKSTSKKAFEANIKTEAKTKPIKQAVAIAYAVKKEAAKKAKKK